MNNTVGRTYAGTPRYMSPELSNARLYDTQPESAYMTHNASTDIWFVFVHDYDINKIILIFNT